MVECPSARLAESQTYGDAKLLSQIYQDLRQRDPLPFVNVEGYTPFWAVTKYNDILEVERQSDKFLNEPLFSVSKLSDLEEIRKITGGSNLLLKGLINMDHAEHRSFRMLTQSWFSPQKIRRLEEDVETLAQRAVDAMVAGQGRCDFVGDVAARYPLRVIMTMLGLPEQDEDLMRRLTQELFGNTDPELRRGTDLGGLAASVHEFVVYFNEVTNRRRADPKEDVASIIANATIDGRPITDLEAMTYYVLLATAGHDMVTATLSGGILALATHPEEARKLQSRPDLMPSAIDEILRWVSPVRHFMRTAATDYELRGRTIRKGDHLMMCYPSANFDEDIFPDPYNFKIDRSPNRHLAFGYGSHLCLGLNLAKMELRTFFRLLSERVELDSIEVENEARYVENPIVSGPETPADPVPVA